MKGVKADWVYMFTYQLLENPNKYLVSVEEYFGIFKKRTM